MVLIGKVDRYGTTSKAHQDQTINLRVKTAVNLLGFDSFRGRNAGVCWVGRFEGGGYRGGKGAVGADIDDQLTY